jgi:hypothetical protein
MNDHNRLRLNGSEEALIRSLLGHEVRFVVIGGHAVCFYGHDRPVSHLDP